MTGFGEADVIQELEEQIKTLTAERDEALKQVEKERGNHHQTIHTAESFRKALVRTEGELSKAISNTVGLIAERDALRADLRAAVEALQSVKYDSDQGLPCDGRTMNYVNAALASPGLVALEDSNEQQ